MTTDADLVALKRGDLATVDAALKTAIETIRGLDLKTRGQSRHALESLHIAWAIVAAARPLPSNDSSK